MRTSKLLSEIKRKMKGRFPLKLIALFIAIMPLMLLLITRTTISNVSAVEAAGVGVYWDGNCRDPASSIDWGTLKPGSAKNVIVYIKNEKAENVTLSMKTENWSPSNASIYMTLTWNYSGQPISSGKVIPVKLALSISINISGITNFNFNLIIEAYTYEEHKPGDTNGDGIVNLIDLTVLALSWQKRIGDTEYNERADFNHDGFVDIKDLIILAQNWYK